MDTDKFNYVYSCDLDINVQLKIWNEWLRLPVKYPDLPQSAQVALTVWDIYGPGRAVPGPDLEVLNDSEKRSSNFMYLMVEFPRVKTNDKEYSIVYYEKENLVESKHHRLARSLRSGPSDHDLKPNAATRDQLNEAKQALELLGKWRPMDVEDSLELLSSHFTNPTVRRYAVARLQQADDEGDKSVRVMRSLLAAQQTFVDRLVQLMKAVQRESGNRKKKALLADNEKVNLSDIEPIPLPLEPQIRIRGIVPETATLFKSALMPAKLIFKTEDGAMYPVIFKHGDDLRQDQLILQIISLMDKVRPACDHLKVVCFPFDAV
ncbi:hypothetical protein XENOCAPTIV_002214 [Xenoophorus captivus]|uniref:Phosphatidylinositol 3-kinase catalytic subunit type 3 n=1 Tax=Xenoophorus captivus TaxID=1517983 RepID=A0ABV0Q4E1_9TELE